MGREGVAKPMYLKKRVMKRGLFLSLILDKDTRRRSRKDRKNPDVT